MVLHFENAQITLKTRLKITFAHSFNHNFSSTNGKHACAPSIPELCIFIFRAPKFQSLGQATPRTLRNVQKPIKDLENSSSHTHTHTHTHIMSPIQTLARKSASIFSKPQFIFSKLITTPLHGFLSLKNLFLALILKLKFVF